MGTRAVPTLRPDLLLVPASRPIACASAAYPASLSGSAASAIACGGSWCAKLCAAPRRLSMIAAA